MTNETSIMPREGTSTRLLFQIANVLSVLFIALGLLLWYGMNFNDPYDGHDWHDMTIGKSGQVMIGAGALRFVGVLWNFYACAFAKAKGDSSGKSTLRSEAAKDAMGANYVPIPHDYDDDDDAGAVECARPGGSRIVGPKARRRRQRLCYGCLALGLGLSLASVFVVPSQIRAFVRAGLEDYAIVSSADASGFKQFRNRSYTGDDYLYVYAFNITNPKDVLESGAKPKLDEIGPFVFASYQIRSDFVWHHENDTLSYREWHYYEFDKYLTLESTNGTYDSADVEITTINMIFQGMQTEIGDLYWHLVCDDLVWEDDFSRLFTKISINQLLGGYSVDVHVLGASIPIAFPGILPNSTKPEDDPAYKAKSIMRVGKENHTAAFDLIEWMGMNTLETVCPYGETLPGGNTCGPNKLPCCQEKGSDNKVPVWGNEYFDGRYDADANRVGASLGEQFPLNVEKGSSIVAFTNTAYRKILLNNENDLEVDWKGAKLLRFVLDPNTLLNETLDPANGRYYLGGPSGFLANMSVLEQGLGIFVSLPHFLHGDASLVNAVEGLAPDPNKHELYLDIEPKSGSTSVAHQRAQISVRLPSPIEWPSGEKWFPHLSDARSFVPILWFDDCSTPTEEGLQEIFTMYLGYDMANYIYVVSALAASGFAIGILFEIALDIRAARLRSEKGAAPPSSDA